MNLPASCTIPMVPITPCPLHLCLLLPLSCTQLNLSDNKLGPRGAKALAPAIADSPSLTRLDVSGVNFMGKEGEAVLRKVIEGRSGFELLL